MHVILPSIHFILLQEKSQPNVCVNETWGTGTAEAGPDAVFTTQLN